MQPHVQFATGCPSVVLLYMDADHSPVHASPPVKFAARFAHTHGAALLKKVSSL